MRLWFNIQDRMLAKSNLKGDPVYRYIICLVSLPKNVLVLCKTFRALHISIRKNYKCFKTIFIYVNFSSMAHRKPFPPKALALNFPCQVSSISTSVPQNSFQVFWSFRFQLQCYDSERPSKTILTEISILLYSPPLSLVCFLHRTFNNLIVLSGYLEFISPARKWAWRKQRPRLTV